MFLQIHTLTSYHAALLNRDDAGLAKRIPFGSAERMRVSSQCLKRHWRQALKDVISLPSGIRTRHFFEREVCRRVIAEGVEDEKARELTGKLIDAVMHSKEAREKDSLFLKQPVLFGRPEADYFVSLITECARSGEDPGSTLKDRVKAEKKNFRALLQAAGGSDLESGIEGALFGRFVTSDILARTDASVHVAHAFTVHSLNNEVDYFTVVDDLKEPGEDAGAAHAGDMELGAGLFYGYVVVDVPLLVSNLSGCERQAWREQTEACADARDVLAALVHSIATVSPGAKLGATAPYARTDCALLETGTTQPRALANAYLEPLPARGDLMQQSVNTMGHYLKSLDDMFGEETSRFVSATRDTTSLPCAHRGPLSETIDGALDSIFGGQ
ncbi:type I-E CRISPR-associated protein Cas7/Cse4/CasC [Alkalilimnicola ehrlichii MLHE-1]|uniref:CRISPR-associated protein, Cse4 family n=1 Tax=Alkalilimnicola ehrlichii (strain ATCC BAA-1101 / DSM 17681 / MLHE-1) TaxID=187272 RepID=Q0AA32_ALKEH|nr:type I-E CRISPR-associated protein Cas7/Cse4/CasC [Alkalilimnicola ehrlichii]ABI56305.1 CRISPR-associated protein, Cse4 family [Alkalilimnicola ehrlichii MLHE-1]